MSPPAPRTVSRRSHALRRVVAGLRSPWARGVFLALAVAAAVLAVVLEREAVGDALGRLSAGHLLLAGTFSLANVVFALLSWRTVLAGLGVRLPLRDAGRVYLVGQVGKYLPGGVWNLVASAELGSDHGVARRRTVGAMLLAVLLSVAMAGVVVLGVLPGVEDTPLERFWPLLLLSPLPFLVVLPPVTNTVLAVVLRLTRQSPLDERIGARSTVRACSTALVSWLAVGAQVWVLAVGLGATADWRTFRLAVGGYALAWAVGFVLVVLPAGVGAREAVLALTLAPVLGTGQVLVLVLVSRVLMTLADLVTAGSALLVARTTPRMVGGPG